LDFFMYYAHSINNHDRTEDSKLSAGEDSFR
jgi:hypothetical protein